MMMEKYGVANEQEQRTYEVVLPTPGKPDDFKVIATGLTLNEASVVFNENLHSIIRPEK